MQCINDKKHKHCDFHLTVTDLGLVSVVTQSIYGGLLWERGKAIPISQDFAL